VISNARQGESVFSKRALFNMVGYVPHPGQVPVHRSKASRRVLACGVRWGKTRCAAMEALAAALAPCTRSFGWIVAPTYDLAEKVFREIVVIVAEHLRHMIVSLKEHEQRLILRNFGGGVSEIRGKSADNPVSLLGEGLDWLIIDEAARLKPTIWENHLTQRLLDRRGWGLLISTPRGKGWFYDAWRRGQGPTRDPDFESWNLPSWSNPHLPGDLIERERGRFPERVFKQEYGGEFLEGAGSVFRYVREAATGDWVESPTRKRDPSPFFYIGLDLAKVEDYTVMVVMDLKSKQVVAVDRFHRLDWSIQIGRIKAMYSRYYPSKVLCDTTGAGEPIYEALRKENLLVEPYPFTAKSKSALIDNLALMLEKRQLILPKVELWPEGIEELEAFEFSVTDLGNVRTGAPSGIHDDCVIALALAAWKVARHRTPLVG
jgi:Terminase RNaseH-like domain/Terminase large subunit, T4likevirus-type, N-terminal